MPGHAFSKQINIIKPTNLFMDLQLKNKRILITGTSAGIGLAIAKEVAAITAYLCSPRSSATNGAPIRVDGGVVKSMA